MAFPANASMPSFSPSKVEIPGSAKTANRPGSSLPRGRNFKGNRFEKAAAPAKAKPKVKAKASGKKGPPLPPAAFALAAAMKGAPAKGSK